MLNYRESATVAMVQRMHVLFADQYEDSLESALYHWNVLDLYYGLLLSKWA